MDDLCATKRKDVVLIVCAISFQDFQPMWSWSTNVTDRETDRQIDGQTDDMRSQDCALHYSASHGKNSRKQNIFVYNIMCTLWGQTEAWSVENQTWIVNCK